MQTLEFEAQVTAHPAAERDLVREQIEPTIPAALRQLRRSSAILATAGTTSTTIEHNGPRR